MADLLGDLGDLGVHRLLVGSHSIEFGAQLVKGGIESFIGFGLGDNELLHEALKVGLGFRWWRGWSVGGLVLVPRRLHGILRGGWGFL